MSALRILIVDDHPVVREGLCRMLEQEPSFEVVGEAASGAAALALVERVEADIALVDLRLPDVDGIELIRRLKALRPALLVVVISFQADVFVPRALEAGASGYLMKDIGREELIRALWAVQRGQTPLFVSVERGLVTQLAAIMREATPAGPLTERQLQILRLLAQGATNAAIEAQLFLSHSTVRRELRQIFAVLGASNRAAAVHEATRRQLF